MKHMFYLIGQPGAGKTTVMRAALEGAAGEAISQPFLHIRYPGGVELGGVRPGFGGTDMLPLNVQPKVVEWLRTTSAAAVVGEGDRLANDKFFDAVVGAGWDLTVAYLDCGDDVGAMRRADRGSNQNAAWVKGRVSKARRLAQTWGDPAWILDATWPIHVLAGLIETHPAISALRASNPIPEMLPHA